MRLGRVIIGVLGLALPLLVGCGDDADEGPTHALIVVSPHPDDESILAAGTIHRLAADPAWFVHAVYISAGDRATAPGDCSGIPEDRKTELIVELREDETRAAWAVLAPTREVPIDFLRGPDQGLVASTTVADGVRQDVLTAAGLIAVEGGVPIASRVPASVRTVLLLTTAIYDAHPDHRVAYRVARQAAERLRRELEIEVRIWSAIVHDEFKQIDFPICCPGDLHWPAAGPRHDYLALTDSPARPRPPTWDRVEDVSDRTAVRHEALARHVSQVVGHPPLCMPVYIPDYYRRWMEKVEEPFYEETL